jgi:hypothetical protein
MNQFITRVELHDASSHDYERLHTFMAAQKISTHDHCRRWTDLRSADRDLLFFRRFVG